MGHELRNLRNNAGEKAGPRLSEPGEQWQDRPTLSLSAEEHVGGHFPQKGCETGRYFLDSVISLVQMLLRIVVSSFFLRGAGINFSSMFYNFS